MEKSTTSYVVLLLVTIFFLCSRASNINLVPKTHYHDFIVKSSSCTKLCETKKIITVNNQFPGPTLHAHKGETIVVNVYNQADHNLAIHWHGVMQLKNPWFDGAAHITQCPIQPGHNYTYVINFTSEEGTFWWHAHSHALRATVHGAIIVYPSHENTYPFPKPFKEVPIILGEWWKMDVVDVYREAAEKGEPPMPSDALTINGQPGELYQCSNSETLRILVERGMTYLLRLICATMERQLFFAIADHQMTLVAIDGSYTKPFSTDYIMISPGQTMDVLVHANHKPDLYSIAASPLDTGMGSMDHMGHMSNMDHKVSSMGDRGHIGSDMVRKGHMNDMVHKGHTHDLECMSDMGDIGQKGDMGHMSYKGHMRYIGPMGQKGHKSNMGDKGHMDQDGDLGHIGGKGNMGHKGIMGHMGQKGDMRNMGHMGHKGNVSYMGHMFTTNASTAIFQYIQCRATSPATGMFPQLPSSSDSCSASNFTSHIKSLKVSYIQHPILNNVNVRMFITLSMGMMHVASMNNVSFVEPKINILKAYYNSISNVYEEDFPNEPPRRFNYTGSRQMDENWSPEFATKVKVLEFNKNVEIVFQATNIMSKESHPMHLHGHSFYVVGWGYGNFDPIKDPLNYNLIDPPKQSTVVVPKGGWATIRFRADNPGVWNLHCHFEHHHYKGMNMAFIVKDGPDVLHKLLPPPQGLPAC